MASGYVYSLKNCILKKIFLKKSSFIYILPFKHFLFVNIFLYLLLYLYLKFGLKLQFCELLQVTWQLSYSFILFMSRFNLSAAVKCFIVSILSVFPRCFLNPPFSARICRQRKYICGRMCISQHFLIQSGKIPQWQRYATNIDEKFFDQENSWVLCFLLNWKKNQNMKMKCQTIQQLFAVTKYPMKTTNG